MSVRVSLRCSYLSHIIFSRLLSYVEQLILSVQLSLCQELFGCQAGWQGHDSGICSEAVSGRAILSIEKLISVRASVPRVMHSSGGNAPQIYVPVFLPGLDLSFARFEARDAVGFALEQPHPCFHYLLAAS